MPSPFTEETATASSEKQAFAALRQMEGRWNAAALAWDVDGLASLYADDALMYGGRPGLSVGQDGMRAYFASYAGLLKSASLGMVDQHVVLLGADAFMSQGYGRFHFVLADDRCTRSTLRTTWVLRRTRDEWAIALHHFSLTPEVPPI